MNDRQHVQDCPSCGKVLSERGFFCASCAVQVRCKQCKELLDKNAQACVMCGTAVGAGTTIPLANGSVSPMNTLELQEDARSRSLRISFTDSAIGSIGDTLNRLVSEKLATHGPRPFRTASGTVVIASLSAASEGGEAAQTIDSTPVDGKPLPPLAGDAERMREIFEISGEDVRLEEHRLKADSRLEYARRLTYLFIYAQELAGKKPISYARRKYVKSFSTHRKCWMQIHATNWRTKWRSRSTATRFG